MDNYGYVPDNSEGYFDGISWLDIISVCKDILGYIGWISFMHMLPKDLLNLEDIH